MKVYRLLAAGLAAFIASVAPALADYETNPEMLPDRRCVTQDGRTFEQAGIEPLHCLPLFWDLPAVTRVGYRAAAAPYAANPVPQWPRGLTDRIPPLFVYDGNQDGVADDCPADDPYYGQFFFCGDGRPDGFETAGPFGGADRRELCADPDEIPWWRPIWADENGNEVTGKKGQPFIGYGEGDWAEGGAAGQQAGHVHEVSCRRGSRSSLGPWQVGTDPTRYDAKASPQQLVRFENTARLDRDEARGVFDDDAYDDEPGARIRHEWNDGTEFYNHFASHHGVCYAIGHECDEPRPRADFQPGGACWNYQKPANSPEEKAATDPAGEDEANGGCYAADQYSNSCTGKEGGGDGFRNATQVPGRLYVEFAEGRALPGAEDQLWSCDHHVVHQLPPGSYGLEQLANYREMKGGFTNEREESLYGAEQGEVVGGSVGEMIIQYFTVPADEDVRPVNIMFNAAMDLATTWYPPFTWNYHQTLWTPPFDSEVGLYVIHSHHRMVKGEMDILPQNPPRLASSNPLCGGVDPDTGLTSEHMYVGWEWEDAVPCEYWKEPDGALTIRKGELLRTTCYVNNGVTPEAIKHGLVAGSAVQALKVLGAPIPDYPEIGPAAAWGDSLATSPVGQELLYGTHPPINYRVQYKCATAGGVASPTSNVCDPNPAVDADGDYIDGPYVNETQCGGGECAPSTIRFACVGEDEMCIGVAVYWSMDRLGSDTHDGAMQNATSGDPDRTRRTGTPGNLGVNPDVSGICPECEAGL